MKITITKAEKEAMKNILSELNLDTQFNEEVEYLKNTNPLITVGAKDEAVVIDINEEYMVDSMTSAAPHLGIMIPMVKGLVKAFENYITMLADVAQKHTRRLLAKRQKAEAHNKIIESKGRLAEATLHVAHMCKVMEAKSFSDLPADMQAVYIATYGSSIGRAVDDCLRHTEF